MRLIIRLVRATVLAFLLTVPVAGFVWLVSTNDGLRIGTAIAAIFLPFEARGVEGTLTSGFSIGFLRYGDAGFEIEGHDVLVRGVQIHGVGDIEINFLHARELYITTSPDTGSAVGSTAGNELRLPALPFHLKVGEATFEEIFMDNEQWSSVYFTGTWDHLYMKTPRLALHVDGIDVDINGEARVGADLHLAVLVRWHMDTVRGRLNAQGLPVRLAVQHRLDMDGGSVMSAGHVDISRLPLITATLNHTVEGLAPVQTGISGSGRRWEFETSTTYDRWPLRAALVVQGSSEGWDVEISDGQLGDAARFEGTGQLTPTLAGQLSLSEVQADELVSGIEGTLAGRVELSDVGLSAMLGFDGLGLAGVTRLGAGTVSLRTPVDFASADIEVTADWASAGEVMINEPRVTVSGSPTQMNYSVRWPDTKLDGTITVGDDVLQVEVLPEGTIAVGDLHLSNQQAFSVTRSAKGSVEAWRVSEHCWSGSVSLCVNPVVLDAQTALAPGGTYQVADLRVFNEWLPTAITNAASVGGTWTLSDTAAGWEIGIVGDLSEVVLTETEGVVRLPPLAFVSLLNRSRGSVSFRGDGTQLSVSGKAAVNLSETSLPWYVDTTFTTDIGAFPTPSPRLRTLTGGIEGRAVVQGTGETWAYNVDGGWTDGVLHWREPDVRLSEIDAQWHADANGWQISGTGVPVNGGRVSFTGEGDALDPNTNLDASLKGSDIVILSDFWEVRAEPDIRIAIREGDISVSGAIQVPYARVVLATLPESIPRPSRDVQVIGRETVADQTDPDATGSIRGSIRVNLGSDVRLRLFALDAALSGELVANIKASELSELVGQLDITSGSFSSRGTRLNLQDGHVRFNGDPTNPHVDILAVRQLADLSPPMTVGVRVTGLSDQLHTSIYSDPVVSETRAISLLLLGRDLDLGSEADSSLLLSAALELGMLQSQNAIRQLRDTIGLDELSALASNQREIAIVAGKRITRDLFVRYTYNALSAVGALAIRYRLNDRWRLEATNDASQSMDFLYEIRRRN